MDAPAATKICKMCCMDIPQQARKCPHCQHFQSSWALIAIVTTACLPLVGFLLLFSTIFDRGESFESYDAQIAVADTEIRFGDTKSGATVVVMGTIKNTSKISWKQIAFHVDFMDADGRRMDVAEKEEYFFRLPANATSSFKLSFRREFPEAEYKTADVRVVGAKDARSRF